MENLEGAVRGSWMSLEGGVVSEVAAIGRATALPSGRIAGTSSNSFEKL